MFVEVVSAEYAADGWSVFVDVSAENAAAGKRLLKKGTRGVVDVGMLEVVGVWGGRGCGVG